MAARRTALLATCRDILVAVERAESLPMAGWLATGADGRTPRQRYAEAATLAWALDRETGGPIGGSAEATPRPADERVRRPVLMLTRELQECAARLAARLEAGAALPEGADETLATIRRLTATND